MKNEAVKFLREELSKRIEKNPRYSMRAFAKSLGMNIGSLSGLLSGKRPLTVKAAEEICEKLGLTPSEQSNIVFSALTANGKTPFSVAGESNFNRIELSPWIGLMGLSWLG